MNSIDHNNNLLIRPYHPNDLDQIIALFRDAVQTLTTNDYTQEQRDAWAPTVIDRDRWQKSLEQHIAYVAELSGKIVGFIDMSHEGYLDRLYVHKDHTGAGKVSYRLFKKIEAVARDLGLSKITTHCSITAKKPAEFMGFVVLQEQTVLRHGVALTNYVMEKKL